jgi:hypothetical protein
MIQFWPRQAAHRTSAQLLRRALAWGRGRGAGTCAAHLCLVRAWLTVTEYRSISLAKHVSTIQGRNCGLTRSWIGRARAPAKSQHHSQRRLKTLKTRQLEKPGRACGNRRAGRVHRAHRRRCAGKPDRHTGKHSEVGVLAPATCCKAAAAESEQMPTAVMRATQPPQFDG